MKVRISARARDDFDYVYSYMCVRRGTPAADQFLGQARESVEFLAQHPEAGPHPRWSTRHKNLRFWVISKTNFLIFYFTDASGISIERVLDGRRDLKRIIEQGVEEPPPEE